MKFKNLILLSSLFLFTILSTAFVEPAAPEVKIVDEKTPASEFAEFLSHFEKVELPYSLSLNDLEQYDIYRNNANDKAIKKVSKKSYKKIKGKIGYSPITRSKYIHETIRGSFGRGGRPDIRPLARFYLNEKSVAIVYSSQMSFGGDLFKSYNLIVYDFKGNVLFPAKNNAEKYFVGEFNLGSTSSQSTTTFKIDEQGKIWKNTYENVWKNDLNENGFIDNQLVDFKIKETKVFQLNEKGVAEELKTIPFDGRASLD